MYEGRLRIPHPRIASPAFEQVLPLVPPGPDYWSPYSGQDANCGNVLLISLDRLAEDGLLPADALAAARLPEQGDADFHNVAAAKQPLLDRAADALLARPPSDPLVKA